MDVVITKRNYNVLLTILYSTYLICCFVRFRFLEIIDNFYANL
ncbi:putative membrane protein [Klebsiella oxytoca]|nr:putative membrane protein [Klebsiella oxytoca]